MKEIVVPLIVVISYLLGELYKLIFRKQEELYKYIPVFVSLSGGLIAVIMYLIDVRLFEVQSVLEVILIGIVSGSSSTGANQIIKKVFRSNGESNESKSNK